MDKATLRPVVLEILKTSPQTHLHAIENEVRRRREEYQRHDALLLQEIVWELLVQGVLAPGKNSLNLHLPFVHVTELGAEILQSGEASIYDPDGYMHRWAAVVGSSIDGVERIVREALTVFLAGSHVAAVALLAHATEILFDRIADVLLAHLTEEGLSCKELEMAPRATRRRAQAVLTCLSSISLPSETRAQAEPMLSGLLVTLQWSRHPDESFRFSDVSREQVMALFLQLPEACAFSYHLIDTLLRRVTD